MLDVTRNEIGPEPAEGGALVAVSTTAQHVRWSDLRALAVNSRRSIGVGLGDSPNFRRGISCARQISERDFIVKPRKKSRGRRLVQRPLGNDREERVR